MVLWLYQCGDGLYKSTIALRVRLSTFQSMHDELHTLGAVLARFDGQAKLAQPPPLPPLPIRWPELEKGERV